MLNSEWSKMFYLVFIFALTFFSSNAEDSEGSKFVCRPSTHFPCKGGRYIPLEELCDKKNDCPDGEDEEINLCPTEGCEINNGGCSQLCKNISTSSFVCHCRKGYKLANDNRTCYDIDECQFGVCSQICENENGGFKCKCMDGYVQDPDDHTQCKAKEGNASVLFMESFTIGKIELDTKEVANVSHFRQLTAYDVDCSTGMMFWAHNTGYRVNIDKAPIEDPSNQTQILKGEFNRFLPEVTSLAVDWMYKHIYWIEVELGSRENGKMKLTDFEGKMEKILFRDTTHAYGLTLNPSEGWMFYVNTPRNPYEIKRAGMDGSRRRTIVSDLHNRPNGLVLDFILRKVYWSSRGDYHISSCNYDGSARRVVVPSLPWTPNSMAIFENWIYLTPKNDYSDNFIGFYKVKKLTGTELSEIVNDDSTKGISSFRVYHPLAQPNWENNCQAEGCSHLCLPAPQVDATSPKISCACPIGMRVIEDGFTCGSCAASKETMDCDSVLPDDDF